VIGFRHSDLARDALDGTRGPRDGHAQGALGHRRPFYNEHKAVVGTATQPLANRFHFRLCHAQGRELVAVQEPLDAAVPLGVRSQFSAQAWVFLPCRSEQAVKARQPVAQDDSALS
jgi:hypothetical protein